MTDVPNVSVVIPTRNRLPLLQEAVGSVLAQTLSSCEVVVVDDASSDSTPEWLSTQSAQRVHVVRLEEHAERSHARNRGLEQARGMFVLFLDDDDRLRPTALGDLQKALLTSPGAIGAVGAHILFNEGGQRRRVHHPRRAFKRTVWLDLLAGWMSPGGTVLFRTESIRVLGGWDESITGFEDRELLLRVSRQSPILLVPQAVLEKRAHSGQWRTTEVREHQALWSRAFVEALPPSERPQGYAAYTANRLWNAARRAYGNLRPREAVGLYLRAVRVCPLIVTSPLLRRRIGVGFAKSLLGVAIGRNGVIWARKAKRLVTGAMGRDVEEAKQDARPA